MSKHYYSQVVNDSYLYTEPKSNNRVQEMVEKNVNKFDSMIKKAKVWKC